MGRNGSMKTKYSWAIVVGKPKMSYWNKSKREPDLSNIGRWVIGYQPCGTWSNEVIVFNTRREARAEAKRRSRENKAWHYHAKKYVP
jgi:hypothetical protein